ncbi:ParA family protein [Candidatus Atribacteria bacterium 1244-E10-H5-B2]|nr:MAG: ParA family protein [Candidatus Atribacteria bacterium 1244-E10-H5-B2]
MNLKLNIRILRTMHQMRTIHSADVVEEIKKVFGVKVYDSIIKRTIKFADSSVAGEPLLIYAKKSEVADAYRELAKEVTQND